MYFKLKFNKIKKNESNTLIDDSYPPFTSVKVKNSQFPVLFFSCKKFVEAEGGFGASKET